MDVAARHAERGGDRRRVEVGFVAALAYGFSDTPQQCTLVSGRRGMMM
jgi:hypothetical protein